MGASGVLVGVVLVGVGAGVGARGGAGDRRDGANGGDGLYVLELPLSSCWLDRRWGVERASEGVRGSAWSVSGIGNGWG